MSLAIRDVALPLAHFTLELSVEMTARTTAVYGPSGSGKTSLLEIVAGLRRPRSGRVVLNGRVVADRETFVPPRERRVGYVPQDDALFPHLSVRQNVFYGAPERSNDVIDLLEIGELMHRSIRKLSGGERKRVALARALLSRPEVLLLDEPLAGIDVALRGRVLEYLLGVRNELSIPTIYVTHDMREVEVVCEELVVLERGRVVEQRPVVSG